MYVDPHDPANQVRFYRQDPTGRINPLHVEPERASWFDRIVIVVCVVVLALWLVL